MYFNEKMLNIKQERSDTPRINWPIMSGGNRGFLKDTEVNEAEVLHASVEPEILQEACDLSWLALTVSFFSILITVAYLYNRFS